jgi:hypothetical protein
MACSTGSNCGLSSCGRGPASTWALPLLARQVQFGVAPHARYSLGSVDPVTAQGVVIDHVNFGDHANRGVAGCREVHDRLDSVSTPRLFLISLSSAGRVLMGPAHGGVHRLVPGDDLLGVGLGLQPDQDLGPASSTLPSPIRCLQPPQVALVDLTSSHEPFHDSDRPGGPVRIYPRRRGHRGHGLLIMLSGSGWLSAGLGMRRASWLDTGAGRWLERGPPA